MRRLIAALAAIIIVAVPTAPAAAKTHSKKQPCRAWATVVIKQPTKSKGMDDAVTISGKLTTRQEVLTYKASACGTVPHKHHTRIIQSTTAPYSEPYDGHNNGRQVTVIITPLNLCPLAINAYHEPSGLCADSAG